MDLFNYRPESQDGLTQEIKAYDAAADVQYLTPGCALVHARWPEPPCLGFAQQVWPDVIEIHAESIRQWAEAIVAFVKSQHVGDEDWSLEGYADQTAPTRISEKRVLFILDACREILKKQQRSLLRRLQRPCQGSYPASPHIAIRFVLLSRTRGYLCCMTDAQRAHWQHVLSPFAGGQVLLAEDKNPPARAYRKLREALLYLGLTPSTQQTWVDLGASPGSWSYDALQAGAQVWAIDRSPLRADLMQHPYLNFIQHDAFTFVPERPVDVLVCDVIAYPQRSVALLRTWLEKGWCRFFVVTLKFKGAPDMEAVATCKALLAQYAEPYWMRQLCNNKNEMTVCGIRREL